MSKYTILIIFGIWISIFPFLGFSGQWKAFLLVLSGFCIIVFSFLARNESSNHISSGFYNNKKTDVYVENGTDSYETKD